jgi:hypothetical protein
MSPSLITRALLALGLALALVPHPALAQQPASETPAIQGKTLTGALFDLQRQSGAGAVLVHRLRCLPRQDAGTACQRPG